MWGPTPFIRAKARERESVREKKRWRRDRESKRGRERELIYSVVPVANPDPAVLESRHQSDQIGFRGWLQSTLTFHHVPSRPYDVSIVFGNRLTVSYIIDPLR